MKKYILYPVSAVVAGFSLFAGLFWGAKLGGLYSVFYGILAGVSGAYLSRCVLHIIEKDKSRKFIATVVWGAMSIGLFTWLILNTRAWVQTILVFSIMTSVLNYFGFRYIADPEDVLPSKADAVETKKDKITRLASEMRYEMNGDTPLLDKPLCEVDGVALTPQEAFDKGHGALYAEAMEYIKKYVKEG